MVVRAGLAMLLRYPVHALVGPQVHPVVEPALVQQARFVEQELLQTVLRFQG